MLERTSAPHWRRNTSRWHGEKNNTASAFINASTPRPFIALWHRRRARMGFPMGKAMASAVPRNFQTICGTTPHPVDSTG
eukprot:352901-Chlamydomonas_euryale.AAC.14